MTVAGAVLCGGASRRMGRDKALLEIDGVAMGVRVAAALASAGCRPVVAIGGDADGLRGAGLDVEGDHHPGDGPLGGIITAIAWSPEPTVVVAACDLPWLSADVVRSLADAVHEVDVVDEPGTVVVARSSRLEPLCARWPVDVLPTVVRLFAEGERSVRGALARLAVREVPVDDGPLRNVNTPGDVPRSG